MPVSRRGEGVGRQAQHPKSDFEKVDTPSFVLSWFPRNDSIAPPSVKGSGPIYDSLAMD